MLTDRPLTVATLFQVFRARIALTWAIILAEPGLLALIPLFIGFAIDDLLEGDTASFWQLAGIMALLIVLAVARRAYDTRVYGAIRVELGIAQVKRANGLEVSTLNARIAMARALVDFLEDTLPEALAAGVQLLVAVMILYAFSPTLALAATGTAVAMVVIYAGFHNRFYRLNGVLNQQTEKQVSLLARGTLRPMLAHFLRLRRQEIRLSDAEALLYGAIFMVLLGMILFNLRIATGLPEATAGMIFSVVSYSWEFVESALALPMALQSWTRLSEIMSRINSVEVPIQPSE
jgi:ABC-type bacteriocin/lantibiotic exporter with double-glycine peptidase domain